MAEQIAQCEICHNAFVPDKRIGKRQKACSKLSCKLERKRRAQADWLKRNPGAFKGRYVNTKEWLKTHPGYLNNYRRNRQNSILPDIQDELSLEKSMLLSGLHDIQDELKSCFSKWLINESESMHRDIQDELTRLIPVLYLAMIYKTKLRI